MGLWVDENGRLIPEGHRTENICCDSCGDAAGVWANTDQKHLHKEKALFLRCASCGGYGVEIIGENEE